MIGVYPLVRRSVMVVFGCRFFVCILCFMGNRIDKNGGTEPQIEGK